MARWLVGSLARWLVGEVGLLVKLARWLLQATGELGYQGVLPRAEASVGNALAGFFD